MSNIESLRCARKIIEDIESMNTLQRNTKLSGGGHERVCRNIINKRVDMSSRSLSLATMNKDTEQNVGNQDAGGIPLNKSAQSSMSLAAMASKAKELG